MPYGRKWLPNGAQAFTHLRLPLSCRIQARERTIPPACRIQARDWTIPAARLGRRPRSAGARTACPSHLKP
eukprot:15468102-Alexandrium_andersonii.AAC.1